MGPNRGILKSPLFLHVRLHYVQSLWKWKAVTSADKINGREWSGDLFHDIAINGSCIQKSRH